MNWFLTLQVIAMLKTKLTSKGQVTLPKELRERLGLRPGDEIEFVAEQGEFRIRERVAAPAFRRYRGYLAALAGCDPDELVEQMRGA
jgi:AbrB family looped-hinge helix DNA binding protein